MTFRSSFKAPESPVVCPKCPLDIVWAAGHLILALKRPKLTCKSHFLAIFLKKREHSHLCTLSSSSLSELSWKLERASVWGRSVCVRGWLLLSSSSSRALFFSPYRPKAARGKKPSTTLFRFRPKAVRRGHLLALPQRRRRRKGAYALPTKLSGDVRYVCVLFLHEKRPLRSRERSQESGFVSMARGEWHTSLVLFTPRRSRGMGVRSRKRP